MDSTGKAEHFIENISGCGPFQVFLLFTVVATIMSTTAYTEVFMSFGNYNPGWRCMDNVTSRDNSTSITDPYDVDYTAGSCDVYDQCHHVEFNPQTSTIVTEWGLLCGKSWPVSLMISMQMVGMLVFSLLVGQLADRIGRKKTLYGCIALCGILQIVSTFSVSWSMFVVTIFLLSGSTIATYLILMLYISEFMTMKWRAVVLAIPFWYLGSTVQAVAALITKDWRHVYYVGFVMNVICFVPVFWVPESLRWLEVNRMSEKFNLVAEKIARLNKTGDCPELDDADLETKTKSTFSDVKKYTLIDIFRHGYILISICVGGLSIIFCLTFYSMTFGTKALYGDFYINLIATNVIAIPIFLLGLLGLNYMRRKRFTLLMLGISAVCIFIATGIIFSSSETAKSIGCTILIAIGRATLDAAWFCLCSRVTEIYPTVVRGAAVGYASVTARIGGILAPFIIPESNDRLYILTIITGVLVLLSCILSVMLPETKGKPLKDDFEKSLEQPMRETRRRVLKM